MAGNEFLVFAEGPGSNLPTQAEYAVDPLRTTGNVPGIARPKPNNKALLQSSLMAAAIAQFIADNQLEDVVDTLTPGELVVMFINALTEVFIPQGEGIEVPEGGVVNNAMVLWDGPTGTMVKTAGTGAAGLPTGTTAQRPGSPDPGMLRYNSDTLRAELFRAGSWGSLGGATGGGNDDVFYENSAIVNSNYTLSAGKNAVSAGSITISTGVTVTIPSGQSWSIV